MIVNMKHSRFNLYMVGIQVALWIAILFIPASLAYISSHSISMASGIFKGSLKYTSLMAFLYFLNFYYLVPKFLFKKHSVWFFVLNLLLLIVVFSCLFIPGWLHIDKDMRPGYLAVTAMSFFVNIMVVGCATGFRYTIRWNDMQMRLKEEKQKNTEAELTWLKSQLNPHFLFNTLNNISSLVQIDADVAQESIGQLSDLLRYTLYESNDKEVPLEGEIEFMNNYIDLMKLRCNDLVDVQVDMQPTIGSMTIAPLLFISLIENAFKHGVNSRRHSFVHIKLETQPKQLIFTVENSFFQKTNNDRIGSGIGIENLKRRLDLAYPNRYEYVQRQNNDVYFAQVIINQKTKQE
jgi:hypothetical protein